MTKENLKRRRNIPKLHHANNQKRGEGRVRTKECSDADWRGRKRDLPATTLSTVLLERCLVCWPREIPWWTSRGKQSQNRQENQIEVKIKKFTRNSNRGNSFERHCRITTHFSTRNQNKLSRLSTLRPSTTRALLNSETLWPSWDFLRLPQSETVSPAVLLPRSVCNILKKKCKFSSCRLFRRKNYEIK